MNKTFFNSNADYTPFVDATFGVSALAKKDPQAINVTLGTLCDEEGKLVALDCVYRTLDKVADRRKAKYADNITGNNDFIEQIYNWLNQDNNLHLPYRCMASAGGTGAIYLIIKNALNEGETILLPSIGWGTYKLMAKQNQLQVENYQLVNEKDEIILDSLFEKSREIMAKQHKLVVLINDPAQNPTGLCYGKERWQQIVKFYNELSKEGNVVLINDIAYIDYCENSREYMDTFNDLSENVLLAVALSCSKTMTAYGQRLGCCILMNPNQENVDAAYNALVRSVRSCWGSVNNGFMDTVATVLKDHKEEFIAEKQKYMDLLHQRAEIFLKAVKEVGLPIYPYQQGFFVTVHIPNLELLDRVHKKMIENHIYAAKFSDGIRISICSLNLENCATLPGKLMAIIQECAHE